MWGPHRRHINDVLKPPTIDNAKPKDKRYDLTDGGGLVLKVMWGSKTWRFKHHFDGRRLNPRKEDLHRWRETFAGRLRGWGSKSIVDFVMRTDVARAAQRHRAAQRQAELPGMSLDRERTIQRVSPERSRGPDMSR